MNIVRLSQDTVPAHHSPCHNKTMNNELYKKLKDAGFPQEGDWWFRKYHDGSIGRINAHRDIPVKEDVYSPTLSELIEACGDEFVEVRNFRREMWRVHGKKKAERYIKESYDGLKNGDWIAESTRRYESSE